MTKRNGSHANLTVGGSVELGRWPQGENGERLPIEWIVLDIRDDCALLLSRYVLEMRPWHTLQAITRWNYASIRKWLNEDFMREAFDAAEREGLFVPEPKYDPDGDELWRQQGLEDITDDLDDGVFLLGYEDVERCFQSNGDFMFKKLSAMPTPRVAKQWSDAVDATGNVCWWLRSSLWMQPMANIVSPVESIGASQIDPENLNGVRPAVRIALGGKKRGFLATLMNTVNRKKTGNKRKHTPSPGQKGIAEVMESLMRIKTQPVREMMEPLDIKPGTPMEEASKLLETYARADSGDARSQALLGIRYFCGDGLKQDYEKAFKWTKKAAEAGIAPAQADLADHYLNGLGVDADTAEAVRWLRRAADQGFANAQANLGVWYLQGTHVQQDVAEGERLLRLAAAQNAFNKEFAWDSLAVALMAHPDEASKREGMEWATKAAQAGYAPAMNRLCRICLWGDGGMDSFVDEGLALKWAREGAKRGVPMCQAVLANFYITGNGVERDYNEAFRLAEQAGESGETLGLYLCGAISERERRDFKAALGYYQRAVALGDSAAEPDVERMKALMDLLGGADAKASREN